MEAPAVSRKKLVPVYASTSRKNIVRKMGLQAPGPVKQPPAECEECDAA